MVALIASLPAALHEPGVGETLSGIFGSVSLTAWICLLIPQLIENYKTKSADGLSMKFLFIWLMGDIANLSGALWTQLAPTTVALALYFCFNDVVLITQCSYYNYINARRRSRATRRRRLSSSATDATAVSDNDEEEPLLTQSRRRRSNSLGLPGSHRRHSIRHSESSLDPLTRIITGEDDTPVSNPWFWNTVSVIGVWVLGVTGWFISYKMGAWDAADGGAPDGGDGTSASLPEKQIGMLLGYFSAVCYLCARIPQIIKNYQEKSCEGLSLLFFLLSLTGNFTYGASVISYSQEKDYFIRALPWLMGSLGTMIEDGIIFVQFRLYSPKAQAKANTTES